MNFSIDFPCSPPGGRTFRTEFVLRSYHLPVMSSKNLHPSRRRKGHLIRKTLIKDHTIYANVSQQKLLSNIVIFFVKCPYMIPSANNVKYLANTVPTPTTAVYVLPCKY